MSKSSREYGNAVTPGRSYIELLSGYLPALERNILKYRTFQITLVIFYCEHLKRRIQSIVATQSRFNRMLDRKQQNDARHANRKTNWKKSLTTLREWEILSKEETHEIRELIDYRNIIAHEIHRLVGDIGSNSSMFRIGDYLVDFKYDAVERLRQILKALEARVIEKRYVIPIDMETLVFEAAERSYENEMRKLTRRIDVQYAQSRTRDRRFE